MNLPVSDHVKSSFKNPCDIHLKHVISGELGLRYKTKAAFHFLYFKNLTSSAL